MFSRRDVHILIKKKRESYLSEILRNILKSKHLPKNIIVNMENVRDGIELELLKDVMSLYFAIKQKAINVRFHKVSDKVRSLLVRIGFEEKDLFSAGF